MDEEIITKSETDVIYRHSAIRPSLVRDEKNLFFAVRLRRDVDKASIR